MQIVFEYYTIILNLSVRNFKTEIGYINNQKGTKVMSVKSNYVILLKHTIFDFQAFKPLSLLITYS